VHADSLDAWQEVFARTPEALSRIRLTLGRRLLERSDARFFLGTLDGRAVATSFAVRTRDVVGIYGVGTAEAVRRRGIGTAMTWACVGAGRDWGCDTAILQASEMGRGVYASMGFRQVRSSLSFERPPDGSPVGRAAAP
jgi:GNAT superfamily N-acetyltransferase